jgi:hypothetical protein
MKASRLFQKAYWVRALNQLILIGQLIRLLICQNRMFLNGGIEQRVGRRSGPIDGWRNGRRKLIRRETFKASVLNNFGSDAVFRSTDEHKCCLRTPSFLSTGTVKFESRPDPRRVANRLLSQSDAFHQVLKSRIAP